MKIFFAVAAATTLAGCTAARVAPSRDTAAVGADIAWDARRPLSWHDFQGPVDPNAEAIEVAMTAASLSWRYEYRLERDSTSCRYWISSVTADAVFNPGDSWVKPGHATAAVLEHEQGHFDLTQVFKERLHTRTASLIGAPVSCPGDTLASARAFAENGAAQTIQREFDAVWQQYTATQARYDAGTEHGTLLDAQARWSASIAQALRSGEWRAPQ